MHPSWVHQILCPGNLKLELKNMTEIFFHFMNEDIVSSIFDSQLTLSETRSCSVTNFTVFW